MPDIFEAEDIPKESEPTSPSVGENEPQSSPTTPEEPLVVAPKPSVPHSENHIHVLASFCQNPQGIRFDTQGENEDILLLLRAHFTTNLPWIIITIFFAFLPLVLGIVIPQFSPGTLFALIPTSYIWILLSFYYLILFAYAFVSFITWVYNLFFVTTQRIIDIDFSNIVYHQIAATKIDLVEDVHYEQIGFLPSLFDFGTIFLATASDEQIFEADNIPHPARGISIIETLIGKKRHAV
jgi:hypothetical protein